MSSWFGIRWWTVIQFYKEWCVCVCKGWKCVADFFFVVVALSRPFLPSWTKNGTKCTGRLANIVLYFIIKWHSSYLHTCTCWLTELSILPPLYGFNLRTSWPDHRLNNKLSTQSQFTWNSKHTWSLHSICPQFTPILLSYRPPHLRILSSSSLSYQHSSLGSCTK